MWNAPKRGKGREGSEKGKKRTTQKDQHTTTKVNKVIRSASPNLSCDRSQKSLGIDGYAQESGSGHEGLADPKSHGDVKERTTATSVRTPSSNEKRRVENYLSRRSGLENAARKQGCRMPFWYCFHDG